MYTGVETGVRDRSCIQELRQEQETCERDTSCKQEARQDCRSKRHKLYTGVKTRVVCRIRNRSCIQESGQEQVIAVSKEP